MGTDNGEYRGGKMQKKDFMLFGVLAVVFLTTIIRFSLNKIILPAKNNHFSQTHLWEELHTFNHTEEKPENYPRDSPNFTLTILSHANTTSASNRKPSSSDHDGGAMGLLENQRQLLSSSQQERLESILVGITTKKQVEIVIAKFNEDVAWSDMYSSIRTVYDKSIDSQLSTGDKNGTKYVHLPNVGREAHTFLHHIVHNYDSLADVTVFSRGAAPTKGFTGTNNGGHLLSNSSFHDFVLNPSGHFVFTTALWLPTAAQVIRRGYIDSDASREDALKTCPPQFMDNQNEYELRFRLDETLLLKHIAIRCNIERFSSCSAIKFWDRFIRLPAPPSETIFCSPGATFSVRAERIHSRRLVEYETLLSFVSSTEDPAVGYFLSWFWFYLFHDDVGCPVSGTEFDWAATQPLWETLDFEQRLRYSVEGKA